jgi:hypothetical protein
LQSETLEDVMTERPVKVRPLGMSKMVELDAAVVCRGDRQ